MTTFNTTQDNTLGQYETQATLANSTSTITLICTDLHEFFRFGFGKFDNYVAMYNALKQEYGNVIFNKFTEGTEIKTLLDNISGLVIPGVLGFYHKDGKITADTNCEYMWITDLLDANGHRYVGSNRAAMEAEKDKIIAKEIVRTAGVPTADSFTAFPNEYADFETLPVSYPLFVKPLDTSDSKGVDEKSIVSNFKQFDSKVNSIYDLCGQQALVEKYLNGSEFTVSILEYKGEYVTAVLEIIPPENENGDRILGEAEKKSDCETTIAVTDPEVLDKIVPLAHRAFEALGMHDYCRIDFKMDDQGIPHFIEANSIPGMTPGSSYYPKSFVMAHALDYDSLVKMIAANGIYRLQTEEFLVSGNQSTSPLISPIPAFEI